MSHRFIRADGYYNQSLKLVGVIAAIPPIRSQSNYDRNLIKLWSLVAATSVVEIVPNFDRNPMQFQSSIP